MTEEELMSYWERKRKGVGRLFRVGCGIMDNCAPYYFEEPDEHMRVGTEADPPGTDGTLDYDDVVLVVAKQKWHYGSRNFWRVLSRVGLVWTEAKYFSSQGIET